MHIVERMGGWVYRWRRKLATAGVGLLACGLAYHVVFGANGMMAWEHKRAEYRQLEKQIDDIQKENERLAQRIKALKADPAAIEQEAREQLRYARPGEVVYVLPADKPAVKPAAPAPAPAPTATAKRRP